MKLVGGELSNYAEEVKAVPSGGYILVGGNYDLDGDWRERIYLLRVDEIGDTLWTKTIGHAGDTLVWGFDVEVCPDGGFVVGARAAPGPNVAEGHFYVVKVDSDGEIVWTSLIPYGGAGGNPMVEVLDDGAILLGGMSNRFTSSRTYYLHKMTANGDSMWAKYYGNPALVALEFSDFAKTHDGGFVLTGQGSPSVGSRAAYLCKVDSVGELEFDYTYPSYSINRVNDIKQTSDSGYVMIGYTVAPQGLGNNDIHVVKTNSVGDTVWTRFLGSGNFDAGYAVQQTENGGYILAATQISDMLLVRLNSGGETEWTQIFDCNDIDQLKSIVPSSNGGFMAFGFSNSFNGTGDWSDNDLLLIKTDSLGDVDSVLVAADPLIQENFRSRVFPNPANNQLTITQIEPGTSIHIYDLRGIQVLRAKAPTFSVAALRPGIYFLRSPGFPEAIKLIKQ